MTGNAQPRTGVPPSRPDERLESWKEIAAYLKRGVRTVRRWEKEQGLPVHRHLHHKQSSVYAHRSEVNAWWSSRAPTAVARIQMKLAVLPFEALGEEAKQAYLADGLTEDLITELGLLQPQRLRVIARTSVMQYKDTRKTAQVIAGELGVQQILEGTVRVEGEKLRVTVQLIRASDQTQLWTGRYDDRSRGDVLRVQSEIARDIAREIAVELPRVPAVGPRVRPAAHDAVLRGRYLLEQRTAGSIRDAIRQFEHAVRLEPGYAGAHAELAAAYSLLPTYADVPAADPISHARREALEAVQLNASQAEAHAVLGIIHAEYDWDWVHAEREFRCALEVNPSYAYAHKLYAEFLAYQGRFDEAIAEARTSLDLDPVSPVANAVLGNMYYTARRYNQAIEQLRRTTAAYPNHPLAYLVLGLAYGQKQMHDEAVASLTKAVGLSGNNTEYLAQLAGLYARAGRSVDARSLLAEMGRRSETQYVSPFLFAVVQTGLREYEEALDSLEQGYRERLWLLCVLKTEPMFDPLREDPRFEDLLRRMHFS